MAFGSNSLDTVAFPLKSPAVDNSSVGTGEGRGGKSMSISSSRLGSSSKVPGILKERGGVGDRVLGMLRDPIRWGGDWGLG